MLTSAWINWTASEAVSVGNIGVSSFPPNHTMLAIDTANQGKTFTLCWAKVSATTSVGVSVQAHAG